MSNVSMGEYPKMPLIRSMSKCHFSVQPKARDIFLRVISMFWSMRATRLPMCWASCSAESISEPGRTPIFLPNFFSIHAPMRAKRNPWMPTRLMSCKVSVCFVVLVSAASRDRSSSTATISGFR